MRGATGNTSAGPGGGLRAVAGFVGRRLLLAVPLIWAVMTLSFVLLRMAPNDPAVSILGDRATPEQYDEVRRELGLDRPLLAQYGSFLADLARGDVGDSLLSSRSATEIIADRLPVTLSLALGATVASVVLGVAIGVFGAVRPSTAGRASQVGAVVGQAVPNFWLALVLIVVFSIWLGWLPPNGYTTFVDSPADWARGLVLPVAALGAAGVASIARMTRGAMVEVLDRDFVRTLRACGLPRRSIVYRHALRNAAIPVLTVVGLRFIGMLSSAVVIEQIFALPGVGTLAVTSASRADFPVMQALVLYLTVAVVVVNVLVDALYGWLNPRVRVP
ncbi:MAG TPA: ABC transporter permease [Acidimicrobiales bacterium]